MEPRKHTTRLSKPDARSAGEGSGHTARRYVSEESHCGVVPMNHSNKDRTWSAESAEGRLRIKENTFPPDTYPTQSGTARVPRVGECADKLTLDCYSSEIRTGCAHERPSGSVRGAPGNWCPYRDHQLRALNVNYAALRVCPGFFSTLAV